MICHLTRIASEAQYRKKSSDTWPSATKRGLFVLSPILCQLKMKRSKVLLEEPLKNRSRTGRNRPARPKAAPMWFSSCWMILVSATSGVTAPTSTPPISQCGGHIPLEILNFAGFHDPAQPERQQNKAFLKNLWISCVPGDRSVKHGYSAASDFSSNTIHRS